MTQTEPSLIMWTQRLEDGRVLIVFAPADATPEEVAVLLAHIEEEKG